MSCVVGCWILAALIWMLATGDDVVRPTFHPPLAGEAISSACSNFTYGNWRHREFYSPGYPGNYPNKTECIHLLIAPRNYRIQLDFMDDFKIEPSSDCKYDYVEFRDGPFGYSPLIGRFCGSTHPQMMESSSRFMWAHFASDDSIEYKGFRAVYDFYKPGDKELNSSVGNSVCHIEVDISKHEGFISQDDIPKARSDHFEGSITPLDCTWAFYLPNEHRVTLKFEHLMTTLGSCDDSFLEIYEDTTAITDRRKKLCGSLPTFYKSDSNHAYIRLYAKQSIMMPKFSAFFTVFTPGPCKSNLFECGDNTCINKSLECNGNDNCNYKWDEQTCETSTIIVPTREPEVIHYHTVIIGIVGGAIVTIILMAIVITCIQKNREDKRQRHVLRQEERQAMEIEMTNLLNRSPVHGGANAERSTRGNANGPVNHVNVNKPPGVHGNHVSPGQPQLRAHTQALTGQQGEHTDGYSGGQPPGNHMDANDGGDFSDHNGGGPTYRRYLDVYGEGQNNVDDSGPNPSQNNQMPTVVTIEKQPPPGHKLSLKKGRDKSPGPGNRDRTPSPRPDIVQEDKFMYPDSQGYSNAEHRRANPDSRGQPERYDYSEPRSNTLSMPAPPRRLSDSDKSEVWKPMAKPDVHKMPVYDGPNQSKDVPLEYAPTQGNPRGQGEPLVGHRGHEAPSGECYESQAYDGSQGYVEPERYGEPQAYGAQQAHGYPSPSHGYEGPPPVRVGPPQSYGHHGYAGQPDSSHSQVVEQQPYPPDYDPGWDHHGHREISDRRKGIDPDPASRDAMYSSSSMPKNPGGASAGGSRSKAPPPAPPQRHTPGLTHQNSAPLPPPASPPQQRAVYSRTPPTKKRATPAKPTASLPKGRSQEKTPKIFYTRPNPSRADRNIQRQQHPV